MAAIEKNPTTRHRSPETKLRYARAESPVVDTPHPNWKAEYDAPEGQVWVCLVCGRSNRNRVDIGDEACFFNAELQPVNPEAR